MANENGLLLGVTSAVSLDNGNKAFSQQNGA
jgi:hypothetical protein